MSSSDTASADATSTPLETSTTAASKTSTASAETSSSESSKTSTETSTTDASTTSTSLITSTTASVSVSTTSTSTASTMSTSATSSSVSSAMSSSITSNPALSTASRVVAFTTTIPATVTQVTFTVGPLGDLDTPAERKQINDSMYIAVAVILGVYVILTLIVVGFWLRGRYQEKREEYKYHALAEASAAEVIQPAQAEVAFAPPVARKTTASDMSQRPSLLSTPTATRSANLGVRPDTRGHKAGTTASRPVLGQRSSRYYEDTSTEYAGWQTANAQ